MRKKSQMELVGLVIIVILITLGILFLATFALKSDVQKKVFTRKGLAYSTMGAVLKATVSKDAQCAQLGNPRIGEDIIDDCAKYFDTSSRYHCIGPLSKERRHSCDFLQEMATILLNETLGRWNKKYEFSSQLIPYQGAKPTELVSVVVSGGCPKWKEMDSSGLFPINTEAGLVENYLYLCD